MDPEFTSLRPAGYGYALPGVVNQFTIRAQSTGTFFGQCTQLCGLYHSLMFLLSRPEASFRVTPKGAMLQT